MKNLLIFTSLIELSSGMGLIFIPAEDLKLLFGSEGNQSMIVLSRFTGIVFTTFSIACFPAKNSSAINNNSPAFKAMFIYNFLAAVYLAYMRFAENFDGVLLLPAVILHSLITIYFVYIFLTERVR